MYSYIHRMYVRMIVPDTYCLNKKNSYGNNTLNNLNTMTYLFVFYPKYLPCLGDAHLQGAILKIACRINSCRALGCWFLLLNMSCCVRVRQADTGLVAVTTVRGGGPNIKRCSWCHGVCSQTYCSAHVPVSVTDRTGQDCGFSSERPDQSERARGTRAMAPACVNTT